MTVQAVWFWISAIWFEDLLLFFFLLGWNLLFVTCWQVSQTEEMIVQRRLRQRLSYFGVLLRVRLSAGGNAAFVQFRSPNVAAAAMVSDEINLFCFFS